VSVTFFSEHHVPVLWNALLSEFGTEIVYLPNHDDDLAFPLEVIWKEGAEDEAVSPGRYSNIWVQHADFEGGALPRLRDGVSKDSNRYDVVRVDATAVGYSRLVLQANNG
jgi:hypothetical protein